MSKITVPAKTVVVCDICKNEVGDSQRRMSAELHLKRDGLDWQNMPVGNASSSYDMCDRCAMEIETAVENIIKSHA